MADIWINILGDASKLKGTLDGASGQVSNFSEKIGKIGKIATVAGTAVTAAFTAIVFKTAAVGDKFDKMSLRTGIAVEDLSSLSYAADISGTSIETMEKGLKGLTKVMDDASMGIGEGMEAFELLDIAVVDTEGNLRPTIDVLKEAAAKISAIENPTKQAALAMDLFGARAGPELLPLLKAGEGGIEDLMDKAKELGITMSTEAATKAAEFTDRMTDLKGSLAGAGRTIGETLIPAIIPLIEKATEIVGKISAWASENPKLVETITKVAAVVGALAMVGGPILMAVSAFGAISGAITAIGTIATGPIGLLILAIGGIYLAWKNWDKIVEFVSGFVDKIIKFLSTLVTDAIKKVTDMVTGIFDKFKKLAELPGKMLNWGKKAIGGFVDGIKGGFKDVENAGMGIGQSLADYLEHSSPPKRGPLKDDDQWMPNMMAMFSKGITDNIPKVITPIETLTDKIENIFDTTVTNVIDSISNLTDTIESELSNALYNVLSGTQTFGEAWGNMWKNIGMIVIKQLSNIIAEIIIAAATQMLLAMGPIGWVILLGGAAAIAAWAAAQSKNIGGEIKGYQFGGGIDTVPIMATVGEYMISKPMVDFIKRFKAIPQNLIDAIASGMPTPTPAFASGGLVAAPNITSTGFGETKIFVDIHDNKISDDVDIKRLAIMVSNEIVRKVNLNRRH